MQEIAIKAGVSLATVSRTIHSPYLVKTETREQIRQVMSEYRYVYNVTASDFSKRRPSVIGVIIPTTKGAIFSNSTQIIQEKAQKRGFSLIIGNTGYDGDAESTLLRNYQRLMHGIREELKIIVKGGDSQSTVHQKAQRWTSVRERGILMEAYSEKGGTT